MFLFNVNDRDEDEFDRVETIVAIEYLDNHLLTRNMSSSMFTFVRTKLFFSSSCIFIYLLLLLEEEEEEEP